MQHIPCRTARRHLWMRPTRQDLVLAQPRFGHADVDKFFIGSHLQLSFDERLKVWAVDDDARRTTEVRFESVKDGDGIVVAGDEDGVEIAGEKVGADAVDFAEVGLTFAIA